MNQNLKMKKEQKNRSRKKAGEQNKGNKGRRKRRLLITLLILCTIAAGLLTGLYSCASTPPITDDAAGTEKSGEADTVSIALMEQVEVLGTKQWIVARGYDRTKPLLLWLAGGPGGSEIGWTRKYLSDLEKDTVFINWEQPGTGKSFRAADIRDMDVQDFVDHTIALTEVLLERFGRDKLILVGHSWGSIIGLMAVDQRPDLFGAYVGVGQQINAVENDLIGYTMVLEKAAAAGNQKVVDNLKKNGPPPYTEDEKGKYTYLFQKVHVNSPNPPGAGHVDEMAMLFPQEYRLIDTVNMIRGLLRGVNHIYPQLSEMDFERDIPKVEVPVFFPTGRYDFTCVQDIVYRYYQQLEAPQKTFYWLEHSGHNACYEEPERFMDIIRSDVLPLMKNH